MDHQQNQDAADSIIVGTGPLRYRVATDWLQLPSRIDLVEVTAVAVDAQDRVLIFNRGTHPVVVTDADGQYLSDWGQGQFARPHGITIHNDLVYTVDDLDHTVKIFTADGRLLRKLGVSGEFARTGATTVDFRTIQQAAGPFNFPTNLAVADNGDIYVADGYGNARIHRFAADGTLLHSWGEPGSAPGQFQIPHGIAISRDGSLCVADRENSRLQFFSPEGEFLHEWAQIARPCQIAFDGQDRLYVAELGYRAGMWSGTTPPTPAATGGRVSIFAADGQLLSQFGGGADPCAPGDFFAPHDIRLDSSGAIYLSEVVMSAGGNRGLVDPSCHTLQKFELLKESANEVSA